mgnify:FL=1
MKKKVYVLSLIFFLIDLISKVIILKIENILPITVIKNFFYLNKVTNEGAAFSSFTGYQIILILIAIVALIYIHKSVLKDIKTNLGTISISLLVGGILGNLFDRIVYNKVIDFLSFNIFGYMFPIFNIADTFICIGVLLLLIDYIRGEKNETRSNKK